VTHSRVFVNEQGRVTIPAQLRRELNLQPGAEMVAYLDDGRLVLESREHLVARIKREARTTDTGTGSAADELIADRRAEAAAERESSR
jgi:AbrB family looped-hinge helix DNA binding protein